MNDNDQKSGNPEITPSGFYRISANGGELWIPNLA